MRWQGRALFPFGKVLEFSQLKITHELVDQSNHHSLLDGESRYGLHEHFASKIQLKSMSQAKMLSINRWIGQNIFARDCAPDSWNEQQQQQLLFMKIENIFGNFFHYFTSIKCTIQTYVCTFCWNTFAWHGMAWYKQIPFFMYNNYTGHLKFYCISYFHVINAIFCWFNNTQCLCVCLELFRLCVIFFVLLSVVTRIG